MAKPQTCARGLDEERATEFPQELIVVFVLLGFLLIIGVRDLRRQLRENDEIRKHLLS